MLKVRLIPCLDVKDGRVVKGVNFTHLVDAGDPVEQARVYDLAGADELTFLDITASSDARDTMVSLVARTAEEVFIPLTVGGGVRTAEDARRLLRAGADKVGVNTAALERRAEAQVARTSKPGVFEDPRAWLEARRGRWILGTFDEARAAVKRFADAGVERLMLQDMLPWDLDMIHDMGRELVGKTLPHLRIWKNVAPRVIPRLPT